jgi:sigma-B regulation protein RsbU (phosphoserine phosphatase)
LILAEGSGELEVRVGRKHGKETITGSPRYSTSAVHEVVESGEPRKAVFNASGAGEPIDLAQSVVDLKLRALMCVPIEAGGNLRGVLYVDSKAATREFELRDLSYFSALSVQISVALKSAALHVDSLERARLEQSLENAKAVQSHLMPTVPDFPGLDIFAWYRAAESTSGDFYDFFKTRDGRLAVVVGDVTGHGPASALINAQAQASLRASIRIIPDLCEAVTEVNADLASRIDDGNFVTLFVALFSEDGSVQVLSAGHTPPQLWSASKTGVRRIAAHGPALGMVDDFPYDQADTLRMDEGDVLLIFTDGLTEARPPNQPQNLLGEDGLEKLFVARVGESADLKTFSDGLLQSVLDFAHGDCEDDMTLVAVRRKSP